MAMGTEEEMGFSKQTVAHKRDDLCYIIAVLSGRRKPIPIDKTLLRKQLQKSIRIELSQVNGLKFKAGFKSVEDN